MQRVHVGGFLLSKKFEIIDFSILNTKGETLPTFIATN